MATDSKIFLMLALIGAIEIALYTPQIQEVVHRGTRMLLPFWQHMRLSLRNIVVGRAPSQSQK
jgi:hypothetical protein